MANQFVEGCGDLPQMKDLRESVTFSQRMRKADPAIVRLMAHVVVEAIKDVEFLRTIEGKSREEMTITEKTRHRLAVKDVGDAYVFLTGHSLAHDVLDLDPSQFFLLFTDSNSSRETE